MSEPVKTDVVRLRFHKNGVAILEDTEGAFHVLEPQETLRDLAKYIWREESLKPFRIEGEETSLKEQKEVKFVKLSQEKGERLRSLTVEEDPYFQD